MSVRIRSSSPVSARPQHGGRVKRTHRTRVVLGMSMLVVAACLATMTHPSSSSSTSSYSAFYIRTVAAHGDDNGHSHEGSACGHSHGHHDHDDHHNHGHGHDHDDHDHDHEHGDHGHDRGHGHDHHEERSKHECPYKKQLREGGGGCGGGCGGCPYAKALAAAAANAAAVEGEGGGHANKKDTAHRTHPPLAAAHDGHGDGKDPTLCSFAHLHSGGEGGGAVFSSTSSPPPRSVCSIALEAACASLFTSLLPIIVILICPLHWRALRLFVAFAAGALVADVFTHQLPNFIGSHGHSHSHSHDDHGHSHEEGGSPLSGISLTSVFDLINSPLFRCAVAMMFTYLVDAIVYSRMAAKHAAATNGGGAEGEGDDCSDSTASSPRHGHSHGHGGGGSGSSLSPPTEGEEKAKRNRQDTKAKKASDGATADTAIVSHHSASAAIVDLFADTLHNFTDGLTLGASFLKGANVGWHTTLLVLLHEVPHELGDGALLVRGGWTRWEAAKVQVWTGFGNLIGCMVIIFLNPDQKKIDEWVTPLVAGSFLYVALTGMLGELKEVPPLSFVNCIQIFSEAFMFLAGLAFLEIIVHSGMH